MELIAKLDKPYTDDEAFKFSALYITKKIIETENGLEVYDFTSQELNLRKNEEIKQLRKERFLQESDPLKYEYEEALALGDQSVEEKKQAWLNKKREIRESLPYLVE